MSSRPPPLGLCLVRLESQPPHMLITVVTDYCGLPGLEQRRDFLDDTAGATEAVRAYLLAFLAKADE
ncbi:hypothetical protein AB0H42_18020 [Nocardia sp. NPDC050799]|uniref:hypothetical protein n=1 Tax=Nocardia sp. NPDC050799 TaxID=3154842 RepID=UPI0033C06CC1